MDRLFTVNRSSKSDVYILNIVHFSDRISYKIFLLSYSYTIFHQATPIFANFGSLRKIAIAERLYCLVMSTQAFLLDLGPSNLCKCFDLYLLKSPAGFIARTWTNYTLLLSTPFWNEPLTMETTFHSKPT